MTEETKTYSRTIEYLDLENFTIQKKTVSYPFAAPSSYQEAVDRIEPTVNKDGTVRSSVEDKILSAISGILKAEAAAEAMANAGVSDNLKTVNKILRPFAKMEPYKSMPKEQRDAALFEFLKSNQGLVDAIRANAEADADETEGEEEV